MIMGGVGLGMYCIGRFEHWYNAEQWDFARPNRNEGSMKLHGFADWEDHKRRLVTEITAFENARRHNQPKRQQLRQRRWHIAQLVFTLGRAALTCWNGSEGACASITRQ